jgi:hypothetical protein
MYVCIHKGKSMNFNIPQDLNGYHENIIVALKTAAAQRASAGGAGGSGDLRALQDYEYKRERAPSAEKIHEAELRR